MSTRAIQICFMALIIFLGLLTSCENYHDVLLDESAEHDTNSDQDQSPKDVRFTGGPDGLCTRCNTYGYEPMTCERGGGPNQVLTINGKKFNSCQEISPCLCGLMPIQMAYWCPKQCRPECGGTCAKFSECPNGYAVKMVNGVETKVDLDWSKIPNNFPYGWPANFGCPSCCDSGPDISFGGLSSLDFGTVSTVEGGRSEVRVHNRGNVDLAVGTVSFAGSDAAFFSVGGDGCSGQSVAPGQSCTFTVIFRPRVAGPAAAMLQVPSNDPDGSSPLSLDLTGIGENTDGPNIGSNLSHIDFGTVSTDSAQGENATVRLFNSGSANLVLGTLSLTGGNSLAGSNFSVKSDGCSGQSVSTGQSCTVTVVFLPAAAGQAAASLQVPSNDPDTPNLIIRLTGTGESSCPPESENFGWSYCSRECPCQKGEGDCDVDADCAGELVCVHDVGAKYNKPGSLDVCGRSEEKECFQEAPYSSRYCSASCPCASGQGDCDDHRNHTDCQAGLRCGRNNGPADQPGWVDVCE